MLLPFENAHFGFVAAAAVEAVETARVDGDATERFGSGI